MSHMSWLWLFEMQVSMPWIVCVKKHATRPCQEYMSIGIHLRNQRRMTFVIEAAYHMTCGTYGDLLHSISTDGITYQGYRQLYFVYCAAVSLWMWLKDWCYIHAALQLSLPTAKRKVPSHQESTISFFRNRELSESSHSPVQSEF